MNPWWLLLIVPVSLVIGALLFHAFLMLYVFYDWRE